MKTCNRCLEEKFVDDFFRDKASSDGRYSICKDCKKKSTYEWRDKNRDRYNSKMRLYGKKHRRRIHYKKNYGITVEQYEEMLKAQNYCCWICKKTNGSSKRPLVIDHSHSTGKVRGILCYGCNRALATLERPELLQRAMQYLLGN